MKKYIAMLIIFSLFVTATYCRADDVDGVIITNREFQMKESFNVSNGIKFTVHSVNPINVSALVSEILDSSDLSIEQIKSKIDENRQKYFADEEIILTLTNTNIKLENSASGISLLKQIMWWNNSNSNGTYWYAVYSCDAADMFTYVLSGSYYIYAYYSDTFNYLSTLNSGGVSTYSRYGSRYDRGFAGVAASSSNKAHIVMNFYSAY